MNNAYLADNVNKSTVSTIHACILDSMGEPHTRGLHIVLGSEVDRDGPSPPPPEGLRVYDLNCTNVQFSPRISKISPLPEPQISLLEKDVLIQHCLHEPETSLGLARQSEGNFSNGLGWAQKKLNGAIEQRKN